MGFHLDVENDRVAELDCGHGQHVRHNPPFLNRPWVVSEEGRNSKVGQRLNCLKRERQEFPDGMVSYKRTPEFCSTSIPDALKSSHSTKTGVWGKIHVVEGQLRYRIDAPISQEFNLNESQPGIIVPEVTHKVEPESDVRFYVEFYRKE